MKTFFVSQVNVKPTGNHGTNQVGRSASGVVHQKASNIHFFRGFLFNGN